MLVKIIVFAIAWIMYWLSLIGASAIVFLYPWFVVIAIPIMAQIGFLLLFRNIRALWPSKGEKNLYTNNDL